MCEIDEVLWVRFETWISRLTQTRKERKKRLKSNRREQEKSIKAQKEAATFTILRTPIAYRVG